MTTKPSFRAECVRAAGQPDRSESLLLAMNQLAVAVRSQYRAALRTLRYVVDAASDAFLYAERSPGVPPWRVAIHTLWFAELYLSDGIETFVALPPHRAENHLLGPISWENNRSPIWAAPATREEIRTIHERVDQSLHERLGTIPLDAPSVFPWIPGTRLESHIYNIRHIQHHAAQLISRLRTTGGGEIEWVRNGM